MPGDLQAGAGSVVTDAYLTFIERLPQPAMLARHDGVILAMNPAGLELLEADALSSVLGRNVLSFLAPEARNQAAVTYSQSVRGFSDRRYYDLVTLKGRQRTIEVVAVPVALSAAGEAEMILGLARDVTREMRAAREQALLAAIVESSEDAIVSLSLELRIMTWNRGAEKLLGFTAAEAIGQPASLYIPPDLRAWGEAFLKELQGKLDRVHSFEVPCLRKDGSHVDVWTVCFGIRDANGKLLGMSAIHRDLTERKRAERARDYLAAIVESSDDAIISIDPGFIITGWNHGAEKLLGFSASEAIGQPFTIYVPSHLQETAQQLVTQLRAHPEQPLRVEVPCRRKDGSQVEVSLVGFGVRDPNGKLLGMSAIQRDITEQRRAQREQALLAAIVESCQDAIITKAPDYTIQTWNAGAQRLYGYCAQEAIGKPITILMPADRLDELETIVGKALNGGTIHQYDTRRRHKDGRLIDVSLSEAPVRNAGGQIVGVAAIERDISERLRARTLEAQMAAIVKSSSDAIYSLGPGHMVQSWNPGAERLFGYRAEEIIGHRSPTMIPECQAQLDEMLDRVLNGGETTEFESRRRRKDGVILDVAVTASPIYDGAGMVNGIAVITRDITERKRFERALVETQRGLRARIRQQAAMARLSRRALSKIESAALLTEAAALTAETLGADACAIVELRPDGKSLMLRACGGRQAGVVDRSAVDAAQDSQAAYILGSSQPVVVRDFSTETRFRPSALLGSRDVVSEVSMVIPIAEKPYGIIAVQSKSVREFSPDDINFIQSLAHTLGQAMERRRIESELKAARDAALESARAKSAFLANMSHEIRTPLNSIVGLSGLLLDTPLGREQRDFAETIRVSSDVLLETINNVLDFSKLSTGKFVLETIEFDTRTVVQTALDLVADAARKKKLELALFIGDKVPHVLRGDPARLRQVLINLLNNAVKFTERGEVVVKVTLDNEAEESVLLRIDVTDTGIGIPQETQSRLFEPFYQADSSTTRRFGGSGLGLAISAQLVELMGGRIGVISRPGEGSTFWFTAVLEKSMMVATALEQAPELVDLHAIIVDDNAANREIVGQQMRSWGMRVDAAAGGAEALAMMCREATTDPYAIAVLDFQMPEMSGLELANRIKTDPAMSATRLVMMSSVSGRTDRGAATAAVDAWFTKPVKPPELRHCLIALRQGAEPATAPPAKERATVSAIKMHENVAPDGPPNVRILLAEDNPINQKVGVILLQKLGYRPDVAANGREALAALARNHYDLILMDCQMPEMDGYEATREIRQHEAGSSRHTIVIALTAFGLSGDREKCLKAGMDDYLAKPVRMEQLKHVLDLWLPAKRTAAPTGESTSRSGPVEDKINQRPPDQ